MTAADQQHSPDYGLPAGIDPRDPYLPLHVHISKVRALFCEDGCGLVETSLMGVDDQDAALDLAARGWAVRPHSMGGLTSLCKDCVARYDAEHGTPLPPDEHNVVRPDDPRPLPPGSDGGVS